ncbi:response regulator transcription factor [Paenisporosarcina cavernae]|uniref:DNA-binding response regulator n=1 Tax=Paenisporosarcina cavernae TaxID=2320858 RepID=A0A385YRT5_9BACL|nr:response regulator transcription factor [Paenisporosarcina cavernae]AYC29459.1 DNA-binding response regulator [Paenisporosarcina cavernae]
MVSILLIEDEENIAKFIQMELEHESYTVCHVSNGREALEEAFRNNYDVILLDVMLPDLSGMEICRRIRKTSAIPIIMLTARDAIYDRVAGLDAGADDYLVKPFAIEELLARLRSVLRRIEVPTTKENVQNFGALTVDVGAHEVRVGNKKIELTKTEFDLLLLFTKNANRVLSREMMLEQVWGFETETETNVVDVYVRHLRTKLLPPANEYIETIRGVGYVMRQ